MNEHLVEVYFVALVLVNAIVMVAVRRAIKRGEVKWKG